MCGKRVQRIRYAEIDDESGEIAAYRLNLPPRVLRRSDLAREARCLPAAEFDALYGGTFTLTNLEA